MRIQDPFLWMAGIAIFASTIAAQDELPPKSAPADAAANREQKELLDRILNNVSKARDSLKEPATQPEARPLQRQVVTDLQALIDMLKQNQSSPPPGGSGGSQSNSQSQNSKTNQQQKQKSSEQDSEAEKQKSKSQSQADSEEQRERDKAEGSEERHGEAKAAERRAQRQQRLENDIWGHLPPKLRDQLLNTYGERMLPQYEEFVRKFYEALSEPNHGQKR